LRQAPLTTVVGPPAAGAVVTPWAEMALGASPMAATGALVIGASRQGRVGGLCWLRGLLAGHDWA
jgi:hypothetical protein